jgi:hypothetical protein
MATNVTCGSSEANVPALFGENTVGGDALFGEGGANGRGVVGVSAHHSAVEGTTTDGIAVYGGVAGEGKGRGVVGVTQSSTAVEGNSTAGDAVFGSSQTGIGVHGKGGHLGGYFEGNVAITGDLSVQGVSIQVWAQRVVHLEQLVAQLQQQVSALSHGGGGAAAQAFVQASIELGQTGGLENRVLRISGSGFQAGEMTSVLVNHHQAGQNAQAANYDVPATNLGFMSYAFGVICPTGVTQTWDVKVTGKSSGRTSNIASAGC